MDGVLDWTPTPSATQGHRLTPTGFPGLRFAHPGLRALPIDLAGYRVDLDDWRTAASARPSVPRSASESVRLQQVDVPGQQAVAYVVGRSYREARHAVEHRPDLLDITGPGFSLRRLGEHEAAAGGQWTQARHPGRAGTQPWLSYSTLLGDGSCLVVTPIGQLPGWQWDWRAAGQDPVRMTVHGFWSAADAMTDAGNTASLALTRPGQRRYVARWAEHTDPGGRGASGSWIPVPIEQARTILIAELERNLDRWAGTGGSDPACYRDALRALQTATGPVSIDLPGHLLSITEAAGLVE